MCSVTGYHFNPGWIVWTHQHKKGRKVKWASLKIMLFFALHNWLYTHVTLEQSRRQDKEYVILFLPAFCWLPNKLHLWIAMMMLWKSKLCSIKDFIHGPSMKQYLWWQWGSCIAVFQWMLLGALLPPYTGLNPCRGEPDPRKAPRDAIHSYD